MKAKRRGRPPGSKNLKTVSLKEVALEVSHIYTLKIDVGEYDLTKLIDLLAANNYSDCKISRSY